MTDNSELEWGILLEIIYKKTNKNIHTWINLRHVSLGKDSRSVGSAVLSTNSIKRFLSRSFFDDWDTWYYILELYFGMTLMRIRILTKFCWKQNLFSYPFLLRLCKDRRKGTWMTIPDSMWKFEGYETEY